MQIQGALLYADQKQEGVRQGFRNEQGNVSVQARGQGEPPVDKWHRDESQQKLASRRNFWDYQARYGLRKNKEERPWESICGDHAGLAGLCLQKGFCLLSGKGSIDYWLAPEDLMPEKIPELNIDKMLRKKKRVKGKNEALRRAYKRPRRKSEAFLNNIAIIEKANTKLGKKSC